MSTDLKDSILVQEEDEGVRLDKFLSLYYEEKSRSYFQFLIKQGKVQIDGREGKKQERIVGGQCIQLEFLPPPDISLKAENIPLDILFEDEDIIVINKPPGMVVHPAPGNWTGTLVNALLYHCQSLQQNSEQSLRPGIVHRLDKETSGVMVAAKNLRSHAALVEAFSKRSVGKRYLALCVGNPGEGQVKNNLGRHPKERKKMAVLEDGGKEAITLYQTVSHHENLSLVQLDLLTGRTHQIRVHMKHRGCPILGDQLYGSSSMNKQCAAKRQLLHAWELSLQHPVNGKELRFLAPIPEDMKSFENRGIHFIQEPKPYAYPGPES